MQLSIIIVNYNVRFFLEQCLWSVQKALAGLEAEVFVVDNASSDGSLEYLVPLFPWVRFTGNTANGGFAKANNQALLLASGRYILFLNPDTIVGEQSLADCVRFMDAHPDAGACGVHMIDGSGRYLPESKRGFPSLAASLFKFSGLTSLFPRSPLFARYYLGHLPEGRTHAVDVLAGAFLLARKEVLDRTGGFDEAFFMYGEDIDLSYRIRQAGYRNYYFSGTTILHFKGESTQKQSAGMIRHFYEAMDIFARKHYGRQQAGLLSLLIRLVIRIKLSMNREGGSSSAAPLRDQGVTGTLMLGDPASAQEAVDILQKHPFPRRHFYFEAPGNGLPAQGQDLSIQETVFCEGLLTFADFFRRMQQTPTASAFRVHAKGSGSIVGSDLKTTQGTVWY